MSTGNSFHFSVTAKLFQGEVHILRNAPNLSERGCQLVTNVPPWQDILVIEVDEQLLPITGRNFIFEDRGCGIKAVCNTELLCSYLRIPLH